MASYFCQSLRVNGRYTGAELEERHGIVWDIALPVTVELGEGMGNLTDRLWDQYDQVKRWRYVGK